MVRQLFDVPLLPVANDDDAVTTCDAALPYVADADGRALFVHVVEKAGGAPDKASVEQREELAEELFELVRERAEEAGVDVETQLLYGTDIGETILDAARDADASSIVFTPREGKKWWDIFGHDARDTLVDDSDRPVVVLPGGDE
ncbi:Universal stress protein family protein [Halogranum gelatinilyticum]|uniref:Universal stress protein family protein n=1 Tax=Halogranum gelatinilyticum TaxID=660521 RepID=A0A1G9TIA7_9EURY|nr:universal stress protein [Halogranum gelatinilyticum]SDM47393.1 Universal stress protein family protein [Halogranum gelatinilyticum]